MPLITYQNKFITFGGRALSFGEYSPDVNIGPPAFLSADGFTEGWYIADYANLVDDGGGLISSWNDMSVNNRDLTAAGASRPTWNTTGVLFVDGGVEMAASMSHSQPMTAYVVFRSPWVAFSSVINLYQMALMQHGNTSGRLYQVSNGNYSQYTTLPENTWSVCSMIADGVNSYLQVNNSVANTIDAGTNTMPTLYVGSGTNVEIKEIIIRGTSDEGSNKTAVLNYLYTKHNIIP